MAQDHRRPVEEVVQGVLLDDPGFLKEIVERVLQELLEVIHLGDTVAHYALYRSDKNCYYTTVWRGSRVDAVDGAKGLWT